jgi:hypothetical protein
VDLQSCRIVYLSICQCDPNLLNYLCALLNLYYFLVWWTYLFVKVVINFCSTFVVSNSNYSKTNWAYRDNGWASAHPHNRFCAGAHIRAEKQRHRTPYCGRGSGDTLRLQYTPSLFKKVVQLYLDTEVYIALIVIDTYVSIKGSVYFRTDGVSIFNTPLMIVRMFN